MDHTPAPAPDDVSTEQLQLLPAVEVPLQFRLDRHTRELGTAEIAKIKAQLAARAAARSTAPARRAPRAA